jgi:hypothetical protein
MSATIKLADSLGQNGSVAFETGIHHRGIDKLIILLYYTSTMKTPEQSSTTLFPSLMGKERTVEADTYKLLEGVDTIIRLRTEGITIFDRNHMPYSDPLPGIKYRGVYTDHNDNRLNLISFLYHKTDQEGRLETIERAIVLEGIGYGEHPGHAGQPASWYLVGPQIGTFYHITGTPTIDENDSVIIAKAFSIACITNGPLGDPILANPKL